MRLIWNAIGLYISRNLRMGRGVSIPKLGLFTFTPPEVRLKVKLKIKIGSYKLEIKRYEAKTPCIPYPKGIC